MFRGFSVCDFGIWRAEECFGVSLCVILEFGWLRNVSGFLWVSLCVILEFGWLSLDG